MLILKNIKTERRLLLIFCLCILMFNEPMALLFANKNYSRNPKAILHEVSIRGAHIVVGELYHNHAEWDFILHHIASGKINWLKVAVALHPGTDAGTREMLDYSVGEALENNPLNVFNIALPEFNLENICNGPDVDNNRYDSYPLAIRAINKRQKHILAITDPKFKDVCIKCIRLLEDSKDGIAKYYRIDSTKATKK